MNEYCISVIIPAYNAEKYINRCLDSIIAQTIFENIEVIVINDGSIDRTREKVETYLYHENIKLINIENGGVSNARNKGMEQSQGRYITFVDADDWVDSDCYEKMYAAAKNTDADIVAAGIIVSDDMKDVVKRNLVDSAKIENQKEAAQDFFKENIDVHLVNKLFKKEIIDDVELYTKIKVAEDRLFLCESIFKAKKIYLMKEAFYHYYQNPQSVMHQTFSAENARDDLYVHRYMTEKCSKIYPDIAPYARAMYVSMLCRVCGELYNNTANTIMYKELYKEIKEYTVSDAWRYMSRKHRMALLLMKVEPKLFVTLRKNTYLKYKK